MPPKGRILVAEDDASIRDLICAQLGAETYDLHTARNGAEALRQIAAVRPDAVLLDINMPELDGFGVLAALRAGTLGWHGPVLVLTARHAVEDVRKAIGLGAKDYLAKPFERGQLLARVSRLMRPRPPVPAGSAELFMD